MATADYKCIVERPNAAFRIQAARPSRGRSWRPTRLVRVRLYRAGWDRRRLATAAVAYRGRHAAPRLLD